MSKQYELIWFTSTKQTRVFADFDEAKAWAVDNASPEVNGATIPNVPQNMFGDGDVFDGKDYVAGVFWLGNRFAAIVSI